MSNRIKALLGEYPLIFSLWASAAAFLSYFGMYMYRKPFTAGTYSEYSGFGMDYKSLLVISQIIGYASSKFMGIKIISQMRQRQRVYYYIGCILISEFFLLLFSIYPYPLGGIFLALSAFPLGLIWGIVFQYLEGRSITEILTIMLSANFILSSGIAKSLGNWLISQGIAETAMPVFVGLISLPLCFAAIWMLELLPNPTIEDIKKREERTHMCKSDRTKVLLTYGWLIFLISISYIVLTALRDIRDNFGIEIWNELGFPKASKLYTLSELVVTIFVLICLGVLYRIVNNFKALYMQLLMLFVGILSLVGSTLCFLSDIISPISWMMISGIGLFIPYILLNGMLFDRLISAFKIKANVGFLMYLVDTAGYAFSVIIIIWKSQNQHNNSWIDFYTIFCISGGIFLFFLMILVLAEIHRKERKMYIQMQ